MNCLRKTLSLLLAFVLCVSLCPVVSLADTVTPTPPAWLPAEEYAIFEGDSVYEAEKWAEIMAFRAYADTGASWNDFGEDNEFYPLWKSAANHQTKTDGLAYETALIALQLTMNDGAEYSRSGAYSAYRNFSSVRGWMAEDDPNYFPLLLWECRSNYLSQPASNTGNNSYDFFIPHMSRFLDSGLITEAQIYDHPWMDNIPPTTRALIAELLSTYTPKVIEPGPVAIPELSITIDGSTFTIDDPKPTEKNDRIMIPIRSVAEQLGAVVSWDEITQTVTMTRANTVVKMTLGSTTAYVNGKAITMDVAPYTTSDRTLIPVRYLAEFFDQKVDWDEATRTVIITENKALACNSNLEAWALPMGAMLSEINGGKFDRFGGLSRGQARLVPGEGGGPSTLMPTAACYMSRMYLHGWSINGREDLIETVTSMTSHGHNDSFLADVAYIKTLSKTEYQQYLNSDGMDSYMFPYTKELGEKWGDRGILCWDLFRMSNLVQWGYCAGYISYTEALALLEPAATLLKQNFSSWDEAYENYLDGYNWWARNDVLGQDIWGTDRGKVYLNFKTLANYNEIFDDTLFTQSIIPVPNLSAEGIVNDVLGQ